MRILSETVGHIRMIVNNALIIKYKKIDMSPEMKSGYVDISTTSKRYEDSLKSISVSQLLTDLSIKDNFFFLEQECADCVKGIGKDFKILDVGCGSGIYSKIFGRKGSLFEHAKYTGTEIDERFVNISKKYMSESNYIVSFADSIAMKNNSVELLFCSSTLHYTLDGWKKSVSEFARVSGKYIAITRFPVTKYNKTFYVHQTVRGKSGTENHFFIVINRGDLENYFKEIGLTIAKRDYSSQEYNINGVNEKIVLIQYLLEKNET